MMWKRIWTLFIARNKEFYRDRSVFLWNLIFPFFLIVALSLSISEDTQSLYKVGVITAANKPDFHEQYDSFKNIKYINFINFSSINEGMDKLKHHRVDFLIKPDTKEYWVSSPSPKGYILEKLLHSSESNLQNNFKKQTIAGIRIPYIEWLFPGILGLNMMFNCLFGVGYVVVRYRKNGVLKRISVTPARPFEFLTAQVLSRMLVMLVTTSIVYIGCSVLYKFEMRGSYLNLLLIFALGGFSMISLGLLIASRSSSEELADGIMNVITWPMMIFSEVWFSMEGANPIIIKISKIFPLTHLVDAARKIMNDGLGLYELRYNIILLLIMSVLFLIGGSLLFKWHKT
ncbi:MAG: ABC transporter permease [Spirochaetes bacterium]|nr:ABC transporter permease [Spirochaetota bacterium]